MNPTNEPSEVWDNMLDYALSESLKIITPQWPLSQSIAVNPFWHQTHHSFFTVGKKIHQLTGRSLFPITWSLNTVEKTDDQLSLKPLYCLRDQFSPTQNSLSDSIRQQVSQSLAAFADNKESLWLESRSSLYSNWKVHLLQRWNLEFGQLKISLINKLNALPEESFEVINLITKHLSLAPSQWQSWYEMNLLTLPGWAAWCAYQDVKAGDSNQGTLRDFLAILLTWEYLVDDGLRGDGSVWSKWSDQWQNNNKFSAVNQEVLYHDLLLKEENYQKQLIKELQTPQNKNAAICHTQFVFCIDVRSEPLRKILEKLDAGIQTIGFAGFFGLPITGHQRDHEPIHFHHGLLHSIGDYEAGSTEFSLGKRIIYFLKKTWSTYVGLAKAQSLSSFLWVETMGWVYFLSLLSYLFKTPFFDSLYRQRHFYKTIQLDQLKITDEEKLLVAKRFLEGAQLHRYCAERVIIVGHGSQSLNNPQSHALDCGACGGQSGAPNALLMAQILNNSSMRLLLAKEGYLLPEKTIFIAAQHNTTTQNIELISADLPDDIQDIHQVINLAGNQIKEKLFIDSKNKKSSLLDRAMNWAQTRPEWGLVNNAAMIIAPRSYTQGKDLQGRVFLHEYDDHEDPDSNKLEQILLAPLVVAHWINMGYFTSTSLPELFGAGNKLLHNVVGGDLGVFEGNTGDLKVGLSWQSLHDGQNWRHEPLRLSVFIDAPTSKIEKLIHKHDMLKNLIYGEWIYLFCCYQNKIVQFKSGQWLAVGNQLIAREGQ